MAQHFKPPGNYRKNDALPVLEFIMAKKLFFYLFMLAFMLAILEGFSWVAVQLIDGDDFFDHRDNILERLTDESLAKFRETASDPVLGWRSFGPRTRIKKNCQGQPIEYSYDETGARIYSDYDHALAEVIVVGDSYTHGSEVEADASYPARLAGLLGVPVANHGVGGYGPTQAMLNLQFQRANYPQAKIAVLGVMYQNLYRMVNSYRPVLYLASKVPDFRLQPYMASGNLIPHPGGEALSSLESFLQFANSSFDHDFWAKPRAEFPYLASLVQSLSSNYFVYHKQQMLLRFFGFPDHLLIFDSDEIELNLVSLLNQYARLAQQADLKPVVIFIPQNDFDTSSASDFITRHRKELEAGLLVGNVGEYSGVDWEKYNLINPSSSNPCHPSAYGYQAIAEYVAALLKNG